MLKFFKSLFRTNKQSAIEKYLASSTDLCELERRLQHLDRNPQDLAKRGIWI